MAMEQVFVLTATGFNAIIDAYKKETPSVQTYFTVG